MALKDFEFGDVTGLLVRTAPFLVFRFLVYFGIALGFVVTAGIGSAVGYAIGSIAGNGAAGGAWGGLLGFGLAGGVLWFLRSYLLYMVKAGHIAVLVELLEGNELPAGRGQIEHASAVVRERFGTSSALFALDLTIKGILRAFNRMFLTIAGILPIPGLKGAMGILNRVFRMSLTYLDEVILSYVFRAGTGNPWKLGQTALVLYAQNYKEFLKNGAWLVLTTWALSILVFLMVLAPVAALVALFPGAAGVLTLGIAVVFAWGVKQAVIEPFAMTALMQVFYRVTEGQTANPEWEAKLDSISGKFSEMKQKAAAWSPGPSGEISAASP